MHYKNGREAKLGDKVFINDKYNGPYTGILVDAQAGSTSCNGQVVPLPFQNNRCVTIGDLLHVDDVGETPQRPHGSEPLPA